jgi:hypothetical protein
MNAMTLWCTAVIIALCVLWIASEATARFFLSRSKYRVWRPYFHVQNELLHEVFPDLPPKAELIVNSEGERGSEPPASSEGVYRILVAGGSSAECYFLDQEACWAMRLQRNLETPAAMSTLKARYVRVGSVAKSGVDSTTLHLILRRIIPNYRRIDAVVILVGGSDIVNWLRCAAPEHPEFAPPEPNEVFESHPEMRYEWYPPKKTALCEWARRLGPQLFRRPTRRSNVGSSVGRLRRMRQLATTVKSEVPTHDAVLDNFALSLESSIRLCQQAGARVLVVRQPWLDTQSLTEEEKLRLWIGAAGDAHKQNVSTYYSPEVFGQLMSEVGEVTARVANACGAGILEVQNYLQPPAACFYDDAHFTAYGASIIADVVSSALLVQES